MYDFDKNQKGEEKLSLDELAQDDEAEENPEEVQEEQEGEEDENPDLDGLIGDVEEDPYADNEFTGEPEEEGESSDSTDEGEESEEEAPDDSEPLEFTLKVDGKEVPVSYKSKDDLVADLQKARAADDKFRQASQKEKAAQDFARRFLSLEERGQTGYPAVYEALVDLVSTRFSGSRVQAAEAIHEHLIDPYIELKLQEMELPAEERLAKERQREREEYQRQLEQERRRREQAERQSFVQSHAREVATWFGEALKGLEPGPDIDSLDDHLAKEIQAGRTLTQADVQSAVENVRATRQRIFETHLKSLPHEELVAKYPDLARRLEEERKAKASKSAPTRRGGASRGRVAVGGQKTTPKPGRSSTKQASDRRRPPSAVDYFKDLDAQG